MIIKSIVAEPVEVRIDVRTVIFCAGRISIPESSRHSTVRAAFSGAARHIKTFAGLEGSTGAVQSCVKKLIFADRIRVVLNKAVRLYDKGIFGGILIIIRVGHKGVIRHIKAARRVAVFETIPSAIIENFIITGAAPGLIGDVQRFGGNIVPTVLREQAEVGVERGDVSFFNAVARRGTVVQVLARRVLQVLHVRFCPLARFLRMRKQSLIDVIGTDFTRTRTYGNGGGRDAALRRLFRIKTTVADKNDREHDCRNEYERKRRRYQCVFSAPYHNLFLQIPFLYVMHAARLRRMRCYCLPCVQPMVIRLDCLRWQPS